jgi:hypothetical protein
MPIGEFLDGARLRIERAGCPNGLPTVNSSMPSTGYIKALIDAVNALV